MSCVICHMSRVTCHTSCVTFQMSCVLCHMTSLFPNLGTWNVETMFTTNCVSCVTCHMSCIKCQEKKRKKLKTKCLTIRNIFFWQIGRARRWWVCYQVWSVPPPLTLFLPSGVLSFFCADVLTLEPCWGVSFILQKHGSQNCAWIYKHAAPLEVEWCAGWNQVNCKHAACAYPDQPSID